MCTPAFACMNTGLVQLGYLIKGVWGLGVKGLGFRVGGPSELDRDFLRICHALA